MLIEAGVTVEIVYKGDVIDTWMCSESPQGGDKIFVMSDRFPKGNYFEIDMRVWVNGRLRVYVK